MGSLCSLFFYFIFKIPIDFADKRCYNNICIEIFYARVLGTRVDTLFTFAAIMGWRQRTMNGDIMNIFKKHQKAIPAALMILSALSAMAIPAFAEGEAVEPSGFNDPMLYLFFGFVAGFFTLFIGAIVLYFKIKRGTQIKEWAEDEGSIKLYEDLDDAKWDAPDSVFLEAL